LLRGAFDLRAVAFDFLLGALHRRQLVAVFRAPAVECGDLCVEEIDLVWPIAVENRPQRFDPDELGQAIPDLRLRQHVAFPERGNFFLERRAALSARRWRAR
jgi:hypothetical protein